MKKMGVKVEETIQMLWRRKREENRTNLTFYGSARINSPGCMLCKTIKMNNALWHDIYFKTPVASLNKRKKRS